MESAVEPANKHRRPANDRIGARTLHDVARYIGADPVFIDERIRELEREWTLERVFETNAGALGIVGLVLGLAVDRRFFALTGLVMALLLQNALSGVSPVQPLLRRFAVRTTA